MSINTQKAVKSKKEAILTQLKLRSLYAEDLARIIGLSLQLTKDLLKELEKHGQVEKYGRLSNPVWRIR